MIYFVSIDVGIFTAGIHDQILRLIKIGYTSDLEARLGDLRMRSGGSNLQLLATMDGNREEEQLLHRRFKDLQLSSVTHRGQRSTPYEWFYPAKSLLKFIGNISGSPVDFVVRRSTI